MLSALLQKKLKFYYISAIVEDIYFKLKPIPTEHHLLMPLENKPFETTVGKGEIVRNEQFLLLPQCFLPVWIAFCHFRQI